MASSEGRVLGPTTYQKKTKHRKRCPQCSRLIQDGELILLRRLVREKWYPVKGIMKFEKWQSMHEACSWI